MGISLLTECLRVIAFSVYVQEDMAEDSKFICVELSPKQTGGYA